MQKKIVFFIIALFLFIVVVLNIYLWISISIEPMRSFEESKGEYLSKFPKAMRNARLITLGNIILLSIASFLFFKVKKTRGLKIISFTLLLLSILLLAWQLFSLM